MKQSSITGIDEEYNDVLTTNEAATYLKIHPVTLRKKAAEWGVPHRRLGSDFRFSLKRLTEWMQAV